MYVKKYTKVLKNMINIWLLFCESKLKSYVSNIVKVKKVLNYYHHKSIIALLIRCFIDKYEIHGILLDFGRLYKNL